MLFAQALMVAGLVLVHTFAERLRFLEVIPRSRWLSMAGGSSVAYVFLHIFPELAEAQKKIVAVWPLLAWIEDHAYLVALIGICFFYGLERLVTSSQEQRNETPGGDEGESTTHIGVFLLHISSFAVYNALIGYLLVHRDDQSLAGLFFFFLAMGFHFLVNDYGLRQDHKTTYSRVGRWVLSAAIVIGWGLGLNTKIDEAAVGVLFAFLAGGVILNVLKEELPEERKSRFGSFLFGATAYSLLLLLY